MRGVTVGLLGVLLGALTWAVDIGGPVAPPAPDPQTEPPREQADHLVCPVADFIRSQTEIALMASRGGSVDLWRVSEGQWQSFRQADLGDTGGWTGQVPPGSGSLVVESGAGWSGAGMVNIAPAAISAWKCGESSDGLAALGGSTLEGDGLDLILYNPYVWDSSVRVEIHSELGDDTPPELQEIYVPAGKTVKVDVDSPLRLRRMLGVHVESDPGKVAFVLQQSTNGETAMIEAVTPQTEWWLPVPELDQAETYLLVGSLSESSFTYRIDLLTHSGTVYEFWEGDFIPGRMVAVPLSDLPAGVTGIRVSGTVALVAALRMEGDDLLAAGPGVGGAARRWLLPGAGGNGESRNVAWLLNPSVLPVSVSVSAAAEGAYSYRATISPESVLAFDLDRLSGLADDLPGYLVESEEEIAVVWTSQTESGAASYVAAVAVD